MQIYQGQALRKTRFRKKMIIQRSLFLRRHATCYGIFLNIWML
uniref:Uncharacterized protein n=1 Tax=Arundo donax TaxID=35708 RepID=A0A0A9F766_ARUDO